MLMPEEALCLVDKGILELFFGSVPMSLHDVSEGGERPVLIQSANFPSVSHQAFSTLLSEDIPLDHYLVWAAGWNGVIVLDWHASSSFQLSFSKRYTPTCAAWATMSSATMLKRLPRRASSRGQSTPGLTVVQRMTAVARPQGWSRSRR